MRTSSPSPALVITAAQVDTLVESLRGALAACSPRGRDAVVDLLGAFRRRPFLTPTEREQIERGWHGAAARRRADRPDHRRAARRPPSPRAATIPGLELADAERSRAILVYACAATRRFAVLGGEEIRRVAPRLLGNLAADLARHFEKNGTATASQGRCECSNNAASLLLPPTAATRRLRHRRRVRSVTAVYRRRVRSQARC